MATVPEILLTLFLVILNGFFVAAEFAIVKVRSSQIEVRQNINKTISGAAKVIVNNLDAYLAATQLGITLASLGLGWVGEDVMVKLIEPIFVKLNITAISPHAVAVPIAFSIITILHIVFGELAPKSIAIRYPTSTTFVVAGPMRIFYIIFRPFIFILNGFANLLLKMIGVKAVHGSEIHSEEELKMIITESHEGGAIEQTERELIQNVFDFDDRRVWDVQTLRKNIVAIKDQMSVRDALNFAIAEGYSRYPVYGEDLDDLKGVIFTKDLMKYHLSNEHESSIMPLLRDVYYIPESRKIKDVLKELQLKHTQMAVVTNEVGEISGLVTMEDILEELVGEIQDEYDNEVPVVDKLGEGLFRVHAHSQLADINKFLPADINEEEHYETLSGLIAYHFPQEIKVGDVLKYGQYQFTILKLYRNSVEIVDMKLLEEADNIKDN